MLERGFPRSRVGSAAICATNGGWGVAALCLRPENVCCAHRASLVPRLVARAFNAGGCSDAAPAG